MITVTFSIFLLAAATTTLAVPFYTSPNIAPQPLNLPSSGPIHTHSRRSDPLSQLLAIMPSANSCDSSSDIASECITATTALPHLLSSFSKYAINSAAEQSALLSWIAFESAELKYNANHFPAPGRPGQGTRTMMMPNFVAEYAGSIPEISEEVAAAKGDPAKVLEAVQGDELSVGSAAWFYSSQCSEVVKKGVVEGGRKGWEGFITECVQTSLEGGEGEKSRVGYWERARQALYLTTD